MEYLNFGEALEALKKGKKISREGWNGKEMWLRLVKNGCPSELGCAGSVDFGGKDGVWAINDFIGMKTADNMFVPWLASQTDVLSEDWCILD